MTEQRRTGGVRPEAVDGLAEATSGAVLRRGDPGYDDARRVFNAMIDRYPPLIVRPGTALDVVSAIRFARDNDLMVSVKGGGHSVAGHAVHDEALMLDMSDMAATHVDPLDRVASVGPGSTLGGFDEATGEHGLATPTGVMSKTGIAGLALGGGLGWLSGRYGLACDNLIGADVVTADGELVHADEEQHPDLFWALRGGSGNFGIVTSFSLRLHPVGDVLTGRVSYAPGVDPAALCDYHEIARSAPDEVSMLASVAQDPQGRARLSVGLCDIRAAGDGGETLDALRGLAPVESENVATMPYREWQRAGDGGYPSGRQHYWKCGSLSSLPLDVAEILFDFVERMPSADSGVGLQQLHGAASRVDRADTAFPSRREYHDLQILSQWGDPAETEGNVDWTRALFDALRPRLDDAVYVNNLGAEDEDRTRAAYGPNYDRLAEIKHRYDPTNFFRLNHNIAPAGGTRA